MNLFGTIWQNMQSDKSMLNIRHLCLVLFDFSCLPFFSFKVLDKRTLLVLRRLLQRDIFDEIEGCISTGKEANVYHALTTDGKSLAVKVYKTSILIFRDRDRYVSGEFRLFSFTFGFFTGYSELHAYKSTSNEEPAFC